MKITKHLKIKTKENLLIREKESKILPFFRVYQQIVQHNIINSFIYILIIIIEYLQLLYEVTVNDQDFFKNPSEKAKNSSSLPLFQGLQYINFSHFISPLYLSLNNFLILFVITAFIIALNCALLMLLDLFHKKQIFAKNKLKIPHMIIGLFNYINVKILIIPLTFILFQGYNIQKYQNVDPNKELGYSSTQTLINEMTQMNNSLQISSFGAVMIQIVSTICLVLNTYILITTTLLFNDLDIIKSKLCWSQSFQAIEMFNITLKTVVVALNCGGAKLLSFKNLFVLIINFLRCSYRFLEWYYAREANKYFLISLDFCFLFYNLITFIYEDLIYRIDLLILVFVLSFIFGMICFLFIDWTQRSTLSKDINNFTSEREFCALIIQLIKLIRQLPNEKKGVENPLFFGFLQQHRKYCTNPNCVCFIVSNLIYNAKSKFINEIEAFDLTKAEFNLYCKTQTKNSFEIINDLSKTKCDKMIYSLISCIIQYAMSKLKKEKIRLLPVLEAYIHRHIFGNKFYALFQIMKYYKANVYYREKFFFFMCLNDVLEKMGEESNAKFTATPSIVFATNYYYYHEKFFKRLNEILDTSKQLFFDLIRMKPLATDIIKQSLDIGNKLKSLHKTFNTILHSNPYEINILRIYCFVMDKLFLMKNNANFHKLRLAQNVKFYLMNDKFKNVVDNTKNSDLFNKMTIKNFHENSDSSVIIVSGILENLGKVLYCNTITTSILGYEKADLIGNSMNKIIHSPIGFFHNKIILNFYKTGKRKVLDHITNMLIVHKNGLIMSVDLYVCCLPNMDHGLMFIGLFKTSENFKLIIETPNIQSNINNSGLIEPGTNKNTNNNNNNNNNNNQNNNNNNNNINVNEGEVATKKYLYKVNETGIIILDDKNIVLHMNEYASNHFLNMKGKKPKKKLNFGEICKDIIKKRTELLNGENIQTVLDLNIVNNILNNNINNYSKNESGSESSEERTVQVNNNIKGDYTSNTIFMNDSSSSNDSHLRKQSISSSYVGLAVVNAKIKNTRLSLAKMEVPLPEIDSTIIHHQHEVDKVYYIITLTETVSKQIDLGIGVRSNVDDNTINNNNNNNNMLKIEDTQINNTSNFSMNTEDNETKEKEKEHINTTPLIETENDTSNDEGNKLLHNNTNNSTTSYTNIYSLDNTEVASKVKEHHVEKLKLTLLNNKFRPPFSRLVNILTYLIIFIIIVWVVTSYIIEYTELVSIKDDLNLFHSNESLINVIQYFIIESLLIIRAYLWPSSNLKELFPILKDAMNTEKNNIYHLLSFISNDYSSSQSDLFRKLTSQNKITFKKTSNENTNLTEALNMEQAIKKILLYMEYIKDPLIYDGLNGEELFHCGNNTTTNLKGLSIKHKLYFMYFNFFDNFQDNLEEFSEIIQNHLMSDINNKRDKLLIIFSVSILFCLSVTLIIIVTLYKKERYKKEYLLFLAGVYDIFYEEKYKLIRLFKYNLGLFSLKNQNLSDIKHSLENSMKFKSTFIEGNEFTKKLPNSEEEKEKELKSTQQRNIFSSGLLDKSVVSNLNGIISKKKTSMTATISPHCAKSRRNSHITYGGGNHLSNKYVAIQQRSGKVLQNNKERFFEGNIEDKKDDDTTISKPNDTNINPNLKSSKNPNVPNKTFIQDDDNLENNVASIKDSIQLPNNTKINETKNNIQNNSDDDDSTSKDEKSKTYIIYKYKFSDHIFALIFSAICINSFFILSIIFLIIYFSSIETIIENENLMNTRTTTINNLLIGVNLLFLYNSEELVGTDNKSLRTLIDNLNTIEGSFRKILSNLKKNSNIYSSLLAYDRNDPCYFFDGFNTNYTNIKCEDYLTKKGLSFEISQIYNYINIMYDDYNDRGKFDENYLKSMFNDKELLGILIKNCFIIRMFLGDLSATYVEVYTGELNNYILAVHLKFILYLFVLIGTVLVFQLSVMKKLMEVTNNISRVKVFFEEGSFKMKDQKS